MVNPLIKAIGQAAKKPVKKGAEEAISKAAEAAGMKAPVVAQKDLTTLQDVHTSLGDRIRAEAEATRRMMEGFDYKYDKGQRVFTEDSAAKNRAPYEIIERTRVGNVPMREDHPSLGPGMGRPIIDPETGRARRTPYEPGYRVRSMSDEGDVYEFVIPASAVRGDVEFARGGKVHISSNPDTMRMELEERRMGAGGLLAKAIKGAQKGVLPAAEREANLAKMLEPSEVKKRMYHGSSRSDIAQFKTGKKQKQEEYPEGHTIEPWATDNRDAVFLTPQPTFSNNYAGGSWEVEIGKSPTSYPVYVQVKKPWDYDNPGHVDEAIRYYKERFPLARSSDGSVPSDESMRHHQFEKKLRGLSARDNNWSGIENAELQDIIKDLGYDSFYVKEAGAKNLGVYDPAKIKSAIGNRGTYDITDPDINKAEGGEVHMQAGGNPLDQYYAPKARPSTGIRRSRSDVDPNVVIPRGLARGFAAGTTGAPGELELLTRILANTPGVQAYGEATAAGMPGQYRQGEVGLETRLPTTEEMEKRIPFRPENPSALERAATGLGEIGGGFYTGPGAPIRAATAIPSAVAKAGRDFVMAAGQPAVNVVKPKGGNWLGGSIEGKLQDLKVKYPNSTFQTPEKEMEFLIKKHGPEGAEEVLKSGMTRNPLIKEDIALNQWIDKTLGKYIKNDMGTPTDPVRLAVDRKFGEIEGKYAKDMARSERTAERAAEETDPRRKGNLTRQAQREAAEARQERQLSIENIYNSPGVGLYFGADRMRENAAKFSGPDYGRVMSTTPAGKTWEDATDALIGTSPVGTRLNFEAQVQSSPWLKDLPPETPVHHMAGGTREIAGFDHVVDILRQDLAAGRLKPEDLSKMTVDKAVLRTGEYDKEMVKASREAQLKSTEGMPVHKEYPEQGMKWYELALGDLPPGYTRDPSGVYVSPTGERSIHHPNYARLEDALKYEGDVLSHCVGGYCPQVIRGESRIFSLRNEAGQPFATIETKPLPYYGKKAAEMKMAGASDEEIAQFMANPPQVISQIKGFKNAAPDPSVRPLIQDFVRSGKWEDVGDLANTGLYKANPEELGMFIPEDPRLRNLPGRRTDDFKKAKEAGLFGDKEYLTRDEFEDILRRQIESESGPLPPVEGMKRGGRVHISSNPDTMRLELADKNMAGGGIAKALKEALKPLPRAAAKTKPEIEAIAERMAPQVLGEYVREKPKSAVTVAGKTKKQFEREKELPVDVRGEAKTPETLDIEKLKGNVVIGIPGDPTIADRVLHGVGDIRLESASPQHGGPLYGLGRPEFWASGLGAAKRVQNLAGEVAEQYGAPVLGKYVMMGPESINYAQHFADANLQAIDLSKMTRAQVEGFNDLIRRGSPKSGPRPGFPGIEDTGAAYLHFSVDPELRKHFNALMQQPKVTEAFNLPSGQDIRFAITEPALRDLETGVTGFSMGRMKPGEGLKLSEHPTYSHDIPGEFLGQSKYPTPYELSFPDTLAAVRANPQQAPHEFGSLKMVGPRQIIDQQMIDELKAYEEAMKRLTGKKKGGVVKLAAGGLSKAAVEALTKMRGLGKEFAEKSAEYSKYIQETKNVPTKELPSFEEWKALQINVTPQNIEQLRKETGNKRGGPIKKKR